MHFSNVTADVDVMVVLVHECYRIICCQVNRRARFEVQLNLGLDELHTLKYDEALRLASQTDDWKALFGDREYELVTLEVVPRQRIDLHVQCNALKRKKKSKSTTDSDDVI